MSDIQNESEQLVVVNAKVLPDIILKVLSAKKMKARGDAKSSSDACRAVGISRSAYYKYKDCVFGYEEKMQSKILSLYLVLKDEKGVLSGIISSLYELGLNILTVNQNIPVDSVASVTISVRMDRADATLTNIKETLLDMYGVVDAKIISGE
ncbi:MAG: ACT domain-containing protein [Ruminococcus sp.]|nr:ACT domain-containing protein [Ruminococcus sp.]